MKRSRGGRERGKGEERGGGNTWRCVLREVCVNGEVKCNLSALSPQQAAAKNPFLSPYRWETETQEGWGAHYRLCSAWTF